MLIQKIHARPDSGLALVGLVLLCLIGAAAPGFAQDRPPVAIDIPAQPLGQSIADLTEQAGVTIVAPDELVAGKFAPAVSGTLAPEEAVRRLLAGSGLTTRSGQGGALIVTEAPSNRPDSGPIRLDPVTVTGWRTTEIDGFRAQRITSALKTDEALADTPASVSVVTEDVIQAQDARRVEDALRNVPGVIVAPNEASVAGQEAFFIRGFQSPFISINGIERRGSGTLPLANVESIEVVKGPSSVLYGDLPPGGFVNVQTKRPQREFAFEAIGGLSQVINGRGTLGNGSIDMTGPIDEEGNFLYRFIASADGGSSFIDDVDNEQFLIAPSLSFIGFDGDLRLDFDFTYLYNDETFEHGVPTVDGGPDTRPSFSTFFGDEKSTKKSDDYTAELRADWQILESTSIDAALSYYFYDYESFALRPNQSGVAPDDTITRNLNFQEATIEEPKLETNLTHETNFFESEWRFLAGGDVRRTTENTAEFRTINPFDTTSVFDPVTDTPFPDPFGPAFTQEIEDFEREVQAFGLYAQVETWLFENRLKLLGGLRYDEIDFSERVVLPDGSAFNTKQRDNSISPRAALLFKPAPFTSVYASYSTSFEQARGGNAGEPAFEPTEGEQFEVGLKQEFFDGRAIATVALFDLTQENLVQPDPNDPTRRVQIGEANTRGVEFEVSGEVIDGLRIIGGYSFLDSEVAEASDGTQGNRLANTPEHAASLFATYDIFDRADEQFTVGGGVFFQGKRFTTQNNDVALDEFITVDVMSEYAFQAGSADLRARLGVKNVFDEEYFDTGRAGIAFRGQPRTISTELGITF